MIYHGKMFGDKVDQLALKGMIGQTQFLDDKSSRREKL